MPQLITGGTVKESKRERMPGLGYILVLNLGVRGKLCHDKEQALGSEAAGGTPQRTREEGARIACPGKF